MKGQTLMLITDISGYTRYFTKVGHEEGLRRAQDLLQIIINANSLGLKLCEVEGDAVFFYAMDKLPSRKDLMNQIKSTYDAFNHYLIVNDLDGELGIKFYMHTGICEEVRIGGRTKLYGMEVIKIHRLLKSIVKRGDAVLMTEEAASHFAPDYVMSVPSSAEFPHIGEVSYVLYNEEFLRSIEPERSVLRTLADHLGNIIADIPAHRRHLQRYA